MIGGKISCGWTRELTCPSQEIKKGTWRTLRESERSAKRISREVEKYRASPQASLRNSVRRKCRDWWATSIFSTCEFRIWWHHGSLGSDMPVWNTTFLQWNSDGMKCRVFATTLTEAAQTWFSQLRDGIIHGFDQLTALFLHQFAS